MKFAQKFKLTGRDKKRESSAAAASLRGPKSSAKHERPGSGRKEECAAAGHDDDSVRGKAVGLPKWGAKTLTVAETLEMTQKMDRMSKKQREKFIANAKLSGFLGKGD